ncbi:ThiF family adenylyltransferase [Paenibacillus glucanolyticus]|uniref:ThiF family adenylyltransferase n=1 Tax=Paenibacillus glucanolyticus TaxID=59843 RepID=UPI00096EDF5C|nr:ThiF family adenylyltransferase [Paenibacillus glucanolyticus]OMF66848.1 hypothetical protein BK142_29075 [Paenibacillus glucanolyticus]
MIIFHPDMKPLFQIVQIGTGANGSAVVQQLTQLMNIFSVKGSYLLADPDIVEKHNLKNQLFLPSDIGQKKADVLARRYGRHYEVPVFSYAEQYVSTLETMEALYDDAFLEDHYCNMKIPVLIGTVDNNFSRQLMHEFFMSQPNMIYVDAGVEGSRVPQDERSMDSWTSEEREAYNATGWTGQIVCGIRWNDETILEPVCSAFPDMLLDDDPIAPGTACTQQLSKEPQKLLTNKYAALEVISYFNTLFSEQRIAHHKSYINLRHKYKVKTYPIEKQQILSHQSESE